MHSHFAFFRNGSWTTVCKYITAHRACGCPTSHSGRKVMLPKRGYYIFMEKTDNGMTQFIRLHCLQNSGLSLNFAVHSFERCLLWQSLGNLCGCLHKPSQWLKTKTPNLARHKLPVGLWDVWMPMVWLTTWPFVTKFTRAGTSAGLDLPAKIWDL